MKDLSKLFEHTKVRYDPFMEYIENCTLQEFLFAFRYPFLVGQDLYQGDMKEKRRWGGGFYFSSVLATPCGI